MKALLLTGFYCGHPFDEAVERVEIATWLPKGARRLSSLMLSAAKSLPPE